MPKKRDMPSEEKAQLLLDAVEDRLAEDPKLLDLRGKTLLADFFLICTGTSEPHIRAITESVLERADEALIAKPRVSGQNVGEWILMDFGDVVLHIQNQETRERFKLEEFWTTPQPKGALPPTPDGTLSSDTDEEDFDDMDEDELDALDMDDDDEDDAAFFDDADQEVEPIDEEDIELVESVRAEADALAPEEDDEEGSSLPRNGNRS